MHRNTFAVFLSFSLIVGVAGPLHAQSLADLSKQEEDRRKGIKAPAKVYTNKDLGSVPAAPVPEPPADVKGDQAKEPEKGKEKDAGKEKGQEKGQEKEAAKPADQKDQAYWSGRVKALQSQLDRDESFAQALQSRINGLSTDFANRSDPAQRAVIDRDRTKALGELDRLKQAIQNDKKAVTDLQDEARRSGVPPGWLR
jgi:hypothetical protein